MARTKPKTQKQKADRPTGKAAKSGKAGLRSAKDANERRRLKEEKRIGKLQSKRLNYQEQWAAPAPSHLVAKLDRPQVKSKYQSYYEFAVNPEKKDKKLEIKVCDNPIPTAGYSFVPVGDPAMTSKCKELSRDQDAMMFIVTLSKDPNSMMSEQMHRIGYHFRTTIVDEAREIIGETVISKPILHGVVEPIPKSQDAINKQADDAIRDLFPRIPNTDRVMIINHAFKKGATFHGEPTVGLQPEIPLYRRVQLAVLAHIRHVHTRYDKLLRETTWINARKVVEPVCLDILVQWRGDEENGRDQLDEILREVVIITDSEGEDDSSDEDSSDEDGEVTSESSAEPVSPPVSGNQLHPANMARPKPQTGSGSRAAQGFTPSVSHHHDPPAEPKKRLQRGFKRYEAAWHQALNRRNDPAGPHVLSISPQFKVPTAAYPRSTVAPIISGANGFATHDNYAPRPQEDYGYNAQGRPRHLTQPSQLPGPHERHARPYPGPLTYRDEVSVRPYSDRPVDMAPRVGTSAHPYSEQRPPQVVRGSSATHNLQDMLVESVETPSSDVPLPHSSERHGVRERFDHPQDSYPRRVVDYRPHSPAHRQEVIVIDDDSHLPRRRRLVQDDNSGVFRPILSRDHGFYVTPAHPDSHLASTSSAQLGDSRVQPSRVLSQVPRGLYEDFPDTYTDPATAEKLPIYDAPPSGHFSSHPRFLRGANAVQESGLPEPDYNLQRMAPQRPYVNEAPYSTRQANVPYRNELGMAHGDQGDHAGGNQYNPGPQTQRQLPEYVPPNKATPQSYGMGSGPDHDLVHNFSQSRLDGSMPPGRDGYNAMPEGPQQYFDLHASPQYQNHSARSFAPPPPLAFGAQPTYQMQENHYPVNYGQPPPHDGGHGGPLDQSQHRQWRGPPDQNSHHQQWAPPSHIPPGAQRPPIYLQ